MAWGMKDSTPLDSYRHLIHINWRYKPMCIIMYNLGQPQSPAYAHIWCQILILTVKQIVPSKLLHLLIWATHESVSIGDRRKFE